MTSPLCWAAATSTVTSQEQVSAPSSKVKGSKVQGHPRGKILGRTQAWPAHRIKSGTSYHLLKTSVQTQVLELQRKIQLLGKMAGEGTEGPGINSAHPVF